MTDKEKIKSDFYKKYIGCYAKRFYTPFEKKNIFEIKSFSIINDYAHFTMIDDDNVTWEWDVEDCVIITNELPIVEDNRIVNINDDRYDNKMYNPFLKR